ncbi:hypothetical protein EST38_g2029 [Candolleomyces aberdarensis]|uniref:Uncharacterized protein n=1 Tax=Candolleomyces aberdarensis TaxID=2316362 RepID=A0A4Q2DUM2_9AGAR|nr:hypothetical protein EST38_g2029 [Candolleomyces aberdarensis]
MALTPSFWSWRINDYYTEITNATQGIARPHDPEGMILADLSTCIFLSVMTAILGVTSTRVLRHIFRVTRPKSFRTVVRRRPSVFAVGSLLLFLLLSIGTIIYCTNTFLSVKEILCRLRNAESVTSKVSDGLVQSNYIGGCRAKVANNEKYTDNTEKYLHFMFARIFQVVFLLADGLFVYRCYIIFSAEGDLIYVSAVAVYVVTVAMSMLEMCGNYIFNEKSPEGPRDMVTLVPTSLNDLRYMWLTFSLITNFLSTGLIITRIVQLRPSSDGDDGNGCVGSASDDNSRWQSVYAKVVAILIEAMLLPAFCGTATIIAWFTGTASGTDLSGWTYPRVLILRMFLTLWLGNNVLAPQLIAIHTLKGQLSMEAQKFDRRQGKNFWHVEPLVFRQMTSTQAHVISQCDPFEEAGGKEAADTQDITKGGNKSVINQG